MSLDDEEDFVGIYLDQLEKPAQRFQQKTYTHGFVGGFTPQALFEKFSPKENATRVYKSAIQQHPPIQISCSGNGYYTGEVGFHLKGEVHFVSDQDISSFVEIATYRRLAKKIHTKLLLTDPSGNIIEAILTPRSITSIWITNNCYENDVELAEELSNEFNLPLFLVEIEDDRNSIRRGKILGEYYDCIKDNKPLLIRKRILKFLKSISLFTYKGYDKTQSYWYFRGGLTDVVVFLNQSDVHILNSEKGESKRTIFTFNDIDENAVYDTLSTYLKVVR